MKQKVGENFIYINFLMRENYIYIYIYIKVREREKYEAVGVMRAFARGALVL